MTMLTADHPLRRLARIRRNRRRLEALLALGRAPLSRASIRRSAPRSPVPFALGAVTGAAGGAVAMYYADPQNGRRRRALLRDKAVHLAHEAGASLDAARRDIAHRARGLVLEVRHRYEQDGASDEVIAQRVRTALGRVVSHPHAIDVVSREGRVELRGPILRAEVHRALSRAAAVRGVTGVEDRLDVYESGEHVPALQGGIMRRQRFELLQAHWAPGPRLLAFGAGLSLVGAGAALPVGALRWPLVLGGASLAARSATNAGATRLFGLRDALARRRAQEDGGTEERLAAAQEVEASSRAGVDVEAESQRDH